MQNSRKPYTLISSVFGVAWFTHTSRLRVKLLAEDQHTTKVYSFQYYGQFTWLSKVSGGLVQ